MLIKSVGAVFSSYCWIVVFGILVLKTAKCNLSEVITAIAGLKAALPCNLTSPTPGDEIALVLWYKDESTTPIYSLDSRKAPAKSAKHVAGVEYTSRTFLDTSHSPSVLRISPVLKEDESDYKCRVDFKNARTRYSAVTLKVIVPPKTPVVSDEAGEILQSLIGPYNEGERLRLVCECEGGDPPPTLTWWRESSLLDQSYLHSTRGTTRNVLDIPVLQRHDLMAVLSCKAHNNNLTSPVSSMVTVDLNFRPLEVRIDYDGQPLSASTPKELVCRSSGSRPPAAITWWKGRTQLKTKKDMVSLDGNTTQSILHFVPSSDDNREKLFCKAENLLIPNSQIEDNVTLDVQYIPKVSLRLGNKLRHRHIQEGNDVYFECSVEANPWVNNIEWVFEEQELHTNTSAGIILSNHSLVLQNVHRDKRGRYICKSRNAEGEGVSNTVMLRVQYAPVCVNDQQIRYGAALKETIQISCEVEADPTNVSFSWLFNRTLHASDNISFTSKGTKSVASYHVAGEDYYGTLYCSGTNVVGEQSHPCQFVIFQAGPPDPVENCVVTNQTNVTFRVECEHKSKSGVTQYYLMEVYDSQYNRQRLNETSVIPIFNARKLPPASAFIVIVFAVNSKGRSESVVFQATTLASQENLVKTSGIWQVTFSPLLMVLIAIIVALVSTAFIFVIMIRIKQKFQYDKTVTLNKEEKNLEVLLHKDTVGFCKSVNSGLDERCPDIISDFTSQDANIRTSYMYGGVPATCVNAIKLPSDHSKDFIKQHYSPDDQCPSLQEPA